MGLVAAKACVRLLPFRVWTRLLERRRGPVGRDGGSVDWEAVKDVVWAVDVAARHLPAELTCLPRAVATRALLRRRGIDSTLHVGAARDVEGRFQSHAWVECAGQVVMGTLPDLDRFVPMFTLDREAGPSAGYGG